MNNKQKLSYMALGAVIMAVGMGLGAVVSPPLIAQRDVVGGAIGVFNEIRCGKLITVDEKGNEYVTVSSGGIIIDNPLSKAQILLSAQQVEDWDLAIWIKDRNGKDVMQITSTSYGNFMSLMNKVGEQRIGLVSHIDHPGFIAIRDGSDKLKWSAP